MSKKQPHIILREAVDALERLELAEGSLNKETILQKHYDNPALRSIIKAAIGTDRYFVRPAMNIACSSRIGPLQSWREFKELLHKLKHRELTGNAAKTEVHRFLSRCEPQMMKWYCRVLNHDLRIGVGKLTIDKVWSDEFLLADSAKNVNWKFHGCALAKKYEDVYKETKKGVKKPDFPQALEVKFDGERALIIAFPREQEIYVFTRSGRRREKIEQVEEFKKEVLDLCVALNEDNNPNRPLFLDGEFLARKWNDTSSIVRKTKNFDAEEFLREVKVYLWDWAPLDQYLEGQFNMRWTRRKASLLYVTGVDRPTDDFLPFSDHVVIVGHQLVYNEDQLNAEYAKLQDLGYEGGVLKDPNAPHVFKRTKHLVKLKPEDAVTGRIIGVESGEDANAAVTEPTRRKIAHAMKEAGKIKEDEVFLYCKTEDPESLIGRIKHIISGDNEYRIFQPGQNVVGFRHGQRLGYLVVELDNGSIVHVGGGFKTKAGRDERSRLWMNRDEIVGMRVDFKQQAGSTADAVSRYPVFVRLREDLS